MQLQSLLSETDLWGGKFSDVAEQLRLAVEVCLRWQDVCQKLTSLFWPHFGPHPWKGPPFVPTYLLGFTHRLQQVPTSHLHSLRRSTTVPGTRVRPLFVASYSTRAWKVVPKWQRTTSRGPQCRAVGRTNSGKNARECERLPSSRCPNSQSLKLPRTVELESELHGGAGACHFHHGCRVSAVSPFTYCAAVYYEKGKYRRRSLPRSKEVKEELVLRDEWRYYAARRPTSSAA